MNRIDKILFNLQKIPTKNKIFLLQNLSIMIKTGIPLADGMEALASQTKNKKLKYILENIVKDITEGKTFGESLEPYKSDFGEMFLNMIKAGEASGRLEDVLKELYTQTKKDHQLLMKVRNALIYPTVILIAMLGVGFFVITFVLPNITMMFADLDIELPLPTRILIGVNNFFQNNGLLSAIALIIIIATLIKLIKTRKGKFILDTLLLKIPIFSEIIKKINLARAARSLSALMKTDIDIVQTLNITSRVVGNSLFKQALEESAEKVKKGDKLEVIFKNYPNIFPPIIIQMISVGEETGALDEVLEKIATFYEEEVAQTMESLPTIIEPILMIVMALAVGTVAVAVMMPIYNMTEAF